LWNKKGDVMPQVCPRCKSRKWNEKKIRAWEKYRYLYIVLFDNEIKVGRAINPKRRINNYPRKLNYYISTLSEKNKESVLIKKAVEICGKPSRGREYFNGGISEYEKIISFIKKIEKNPLFGKEIETKEDTDEPYNAKKLGHLFAIEKNLPYLKLLHESILQERGQFKISIIESVVENIGNGSKHAEKDALKSLLILATKMEDLARENLSKINHKDICKGYESKASDVV